MAVPEHRRKGGKPQKIWLDAVLIDLKEKNGQNWKNHTTNGSMEMKYKTLRMWEVI